MIKYNGIDTCQSLWDIEELIKELEKIGSGDLCEIGVYKGGTAKIMVEMYPDRQIYLFDTFEGLPYINENKGDTITFPLHKGMMNEATYEIAQENLKQYKNIHIYKGIFPKTAEPIKDKQFAFVHLDVDTYRGTKESLKFLLNKVKGKILIHDYNHYKGVTKAVDEFVRNNNLYVEIIGVRQGLIKI